jgi:peptidoglycan/xylan/chitin deacetylase (PgdA/CDA1 family)
VSDRSEPRVALTFDAEHGDHPSRADAPDALVGALRGAGAPATFFLQGAWAQAFPERARRIADDGHLVGSHSHWHAPLDLLTDAGIAEDLGKAGRAIARTTGADPRPWFRCPYGAGADDPRVADALRRAGYRHRHWDVDPRDWQPGRTAEGVTADVVEGATRHGDGAVVLLHVWPAATAAAVPGIVDRLRAAGARLVRLDEVAEP